MKAIVRMKRTAVTIALALCCALAATGLLIHTTRASADGTPIFGNGSLLGRTYTTGLTQADVENGFQAGGERLLAAMEAAGQRDLFQIVNDPLGNGWPSANDTYFVAAHLSLKEYSGWNNWGHTGYAFMVFNPHTKEAYTIRGNMAAVYTNSAKGWANQVAHAGYPKGEDFTVDGVTYQNFTLGYARDTEFVYGKNVDADGVESDLTADDVADSMVVPVYQDTATADAVFKSLSIADFKAAYKAYYADKDPNFAPMFNNNTWKNSQWRQNVTDSTGAVVGNVVYNPARKQMFTVTNTFLSQYNTTTDWGHPVAEQSTIQGVVNQQFSNGVVVVETEGEGDDAHDVVKFYRGSCVDPDTGDIVSVLQADSVGALTDEAAIALPQGVTVDAVKAAVQAAWDQDTMGMPTEYMEFSESDSILVQPFSNADDEVSRIYLDVTKTTLSAVVLDSAAYALYKEPTRFNEGLQLYKVTGEMILGPAVSNAFTVGEKKYQNFLYGAIELTADAEKAVLPGVNYDTAGARTVLDLSDYINIDATTIIIPDSYNIGAADLLAKFKAAYKAYAAQGIALGMPNVEGIGAWPAENGGYEDDSNEFKDGRGMVKLGLHMTDSNAICYYGVTAMLAYNPDDGNVYIMQDAVISNMANYYSTFGAPRGNLTETTILVDGNEVTISIQNFQLGYLTVMGTAASMVEDRNWDFTLRGAVNLDGSKIPGVEYPGENQPGDNGNNNGNTDTSGDTTNGGKKGCGCGGEMTAAGSVAAAAGLGVALLAVAAIGFAGKRRKQN